MFISPHPNLWTKGCTDGKTKAITAEDTVRENPVIRNGGVPSSPNPTLPATEQWVGELLAIAMRPARGSFRAEVAAALALSGI